MSQTVLSQVRCCTAQARNVTLQTSLKCSACAAEPCLQLSYACIQIALRTLAKIMEAGLIDTLGHGMARDWRQYTLYNLAGSRASSSKRPVISSQSSSESQGVTCLWYMPCPAKQSVQGCFHGRPACVACITNLTGCHLPMSLLLSQTMRQASLTGKGPGWSHLLPQSDKRP